MRLTVITVNYNGSESTIKLLKSLQEQIDHDFDVIVIDNASEEADFNNLHLTTETAFAKAVSVVRNSQNFGFSGGNNVGIKKALNPSTSSGQKMASEWILLLNNDTWVKSDFVSSLKAKLSESEGIVGLPLNESGQIAPSTEFRTSYCGKIQWLKPTLLHLYDAKEIFNECSNSNFQTKNYELRTMNYYAIGGAVAIHKDVFEKIGLWDEKYFLYFEDADFSIRARRTGIPISIASKIMIYHNTSSSTKKLGSPLLLRYHYRNALYFNFKNGPWYIKLAVWPWSWWIVVKQILKIMIYHNLEHSTAILKGVFDFYHRKMGKIEQKI